MLDVFGVKDGQTGDLLEVVLLVECQNFRDAVVFHDDAVNYIANARMIFQDALLYVKEKLGEVVILIRADLDEMKLEVL